MSKIYIAITQSSEADLTDTLPYKESDMIAQFDFASELNLYPLVLSTVFQIIDGTDPVMMAGSFEKAKSIIDKSSRLDEEIKN